MTASRVPKCHKRASGVFFRLAFFFFPGVPGEVAFWAGSSTEVHRNGLKTAVRGIRAIRERECVRVCVRLSVGVCVCGCVCVRACGKGGRFETVLGEQGWERDGGRAYTVQGGQQCSEGRSCIEGQSTTGLGAGRGSGACGEMWRVAAVVY